MRSLYKYLFPFLLLGIAMAGCTGTQAVDPLVVTVVQTVAVEVVREVTVEVTVEVTRDVIVTQIIEVPVTPTPLSLTEAASVTNQPSPAGIGTQGAQPTIDPTLQVTPQEKGNNIAPVIVSNLTSDKLELFLTGPVNINLTLYDDNVHRIWLQKGNYSYVVYSNGQFAYDGTLKISSIDKFEIKLQKNKLVLLVP